MRAAEHAEPLRRYRFESPLNAFSEAISVWSATDTVLQRPVTVAAITVTASSGEDLDAARTRVVQRLRRAAQLMSSAIVATFDIVEASDTVYVVGESIDAPTLRERVHESGLLSTNEAWDLAKHLLYAISEAHAREMIHGRINPSNVYVFSDGSAKLAGFGWPDDGSPPASQSSFVAPEVVAGGPVGPASDVWALGALLHFSLHGTAPRAARLVGSVSTESPHFDAFTEALLNDAPEQRPDATEARAALSSIKQRRRPRSLPAAPVTAEVPVAAATVPPTETRGAGRRAGATTAAIAIGALIALGLGALALRGGASTTSLDLPPTEITTAEITIADSSSTRADTAPPVSPSATTAPTTAPATSVLTTTSSVQTTKPAPAVPGGWVLYTDRATGFRIAKPEHWTIRSVTEYRTDFVDPASSAFVRVEWTDKPGPDPVEAWRNQARSFAANQQGYEELRIAPTVFKGHRSAEWEFRYLDRGVLRHALDLGMVTGRYGAALFAVAPEANWPQLQGLLNTFRATFEPPT